MNKETLHVCVYVWAQYIGGNEKERVWVEKYRDRMFPTAILPWEWTDD